MPKKSRELVKPNPEVEPFEDKIYSGFCFNVIALNFQPLSGIGIERDPLGRSVSSKVLNLGNSFISLQPFADLTQ